MALIGSVTALLATIVLGVVWTALGHRLLRTLRFEPEKELERLLCSAAVGVIGYEAGLAIAEFSGHPRIAVVVLLLASAALGVSEFPAIQKDISAIARRIASGSRREHLLAALAGLVLLFEGAAAMAPLTGSDALHYHFTEPWLILCEGFHPDYFLSHSFFLGQGHLLVLSGLALGSEKLSLGLIFLGGVLAAASAACLTRRWLSREWTWLAALTFLLTPVAFWQMSTSGAPDIWMAFFATLGVLLAARSEAYDRVGVSLFAGILAGALAGAKYTGCVLAASLALSFFREARSMRRLAVFFCGALGAGIWPYLRNALWTGDPFFPFLLRWIAPDRVNSFTLGAILADTGANGQRNLLQLVAFPVFAAVNPARTGFWEFFGPLCLAFAPLIFLAVRNAPVWRAALIFWLGSSIGIAWTSGMMRFLLPVLPVALATCLAGVAAINNSGWRFARMIASASLGCFLVLGAGGLLIYGRTAAAAGAGLTSREQYLAQRAPEYEQVQFVNQTLGKESAGKTLVFIRHAYYLRVPYRSADPESSWSIDPQRMNSPEAWRALFRKESIRWVVRSPDYPTAIAAPLQQLEASGELVPMAQSDVSDFVGMRVLGVRKRQPIVVLLVKN